MLIKKILAKSEIDGEVRIPCSKSYAQRAIAIAGLTQNTIVIRNLTPSDDVDAALQILKSLGAVFYFSDGKLVITKGVDLNQKDELSIHCNESGLSTRLFSAFSLLFDQSFTVSGNGSINERTMEMVILGLQKFGKEVVSSNSKLPLRIKGEISNFNVEIDGSISSQFLTGLLIVAPFLNFDSRINVLNLKSKPYIDMTLGIMQTFGLLVQNVNYKRFEIKGQQNCKDLIAYSVEGDWSAASFHIVAGAIGGKIILNGLLPHSHQGDKAILDAVELAGAKTNWEKNKLIVERKSLKPFVFDATECPDLFPPLVVLAAYADGMSTIKGVGRLKHKESDRGVSLQMEGRKIGLDIQIQGDEMFIYGKQGKYHTEDIQFSSHNDHRIAMAMSLFSIGSSGSFFIENPQAIDKSYPSFYRDLDQI